MSEVRGQRTAEILRTVPGLDDHSVLVVLVEKHGLTEEEATEAIAAAKKASRLIGPDDVEPIDVQDAISGVAVEDEDALAILTILGPEGFSAEWNALRRIEFAARALIMHADRLEIYQPELSRALALYDSLADPGLD